MPAQAMPALRAISGKSVSARTSAGKAKPWAASITAAEALGHREFVLTKLYRSA